MAVDYSILEPHVFYGAVFGAALSLYLAYRYKAWPVVVLSLIFTGIAVDVAAHGYQH